MHEKPLELPAVFANNIYQLLDKHGKLKHSEGLRLLKENYEHATGGFSSDFPTD